MFEDTNTFKSKSLKHAAIFKFAGEIRFGPPYFTLEIDGKPIVNRFFSDNPIWSDNERFLAVQEWAATEESRGPYMKLAVFDLDRWCEYTGQPIHGYTIPKAFEDDLIIYDKRDWSKGNEIIYEMELNLHSVRAWKTIQ